MSTSAPKKYLVGEVKRILKRGEEDKMVITSRKAVEDYRQVQWELRVLLGLKGERVPNTPL